MAIDKASIVIPEGELEEPAAIAPPPEDFGDYFAE
jgi:hypothetical protein